MQILESDDAMPYQTDSTDYEDLLDESNVDMTAGLQDIAHLPGHYIR